VHSRHQLRRRFRRGCAGTDIVRRPRTQTICSSKVEIQVVYWIIVATWVAAKITILDLVAGMPEHVGALYGCSCSSVLHWRDGVSCRPIYLLVGKMRQARPVPASPGLRVARSFFCVPAQRVTHVIAKQLKESASGRSLSRQLDPRRRERQNRSGDRASGTGSVLPVARRRQAIQPTGATSFQRKRQRLAASSTGLISTEAATSTSFQFDIDHRCPNISIAFHCHFRDPLVGWVLQAPSALLRVLDSWVARGSARQGNSCCRVPSSGFYRQRGHRSLLAHTAPTRPPFARSGGFQPTRRPASTRSYSHRAATGDFPWQGSPSATVRRLLTRICGGSSLGLFDPGSVPSHFQLVRVPAGPGVSVSVRPNWGTPSGRRACS